MKLDSNLAWKQATEAMSANREVLFAIAGVFVLLPNLTFSLLFPQPQPPTGLKGQEALGFIVQHYAPMAPWFILIAILQAAGTLALLSLFTDRQRPTVGEAIKQGFNCLIPYILAQLLLVLAMALAGGVTLGVAGLTGSKALIALVIIALMVGAIYVMIKTSLVTPVIAVDGERNPVSALKRSWALTKGNSLRLFGFFLLVGVAFLVVLMVIMAIIGVVLALVVGTGETSRIIATIFSSVFGTVVTTYFVAILAAVHRQLAGPSAETINATFD
jgi:Membrane domain of glycerophosphoryl diester phosphodiesterase